MRPNRSLALVTITSRFGLSCAISTPFTAAGDIDVCRLVDHATDRIARGCDSITPFGTTGEGASVGLGLAPVPGGDDRR
jgi:4-hydroxy-tetrahydrodipicolinate synthase